MNKIDNIKNAITMATGFTFDQYAVKSRKTQWVLLRHIFVHLCHESGVHEKEIAKLLGKGRSDIITTYLKKFDDEYFSNKFFRIDMNHAKYCMGEGETLPKSQNKVSPINPNKNLVSM